MLKKSLEFAKSLFIISSGKGGVGKSSIAVNTATLLAQNYKVGLIDSDIYGPSVGFMMGAQSKLDTNKDGLFIPNKKFGVNLMSISSLVAKDTPAIWRGPMLSKMLKNFFYNTKWPELDCLIIDTPPGTGDVHITLCTEFKIDAAILVTTAQKVAMQDVVRAFGMFEKLDTKILGIVENMSYEIKEGKENYIIGHEENTIDLIKKLDTELIAKIPFSRQISESFDNSVPAVVDIEIAKLYNKITEKITKECKIK